MQYVPAASLTSHQFADANSPYPGFGAASPLAGVNAYAYWNKMAYAELGFYQNRQRCLLHLECRHT